MSTLSLFTTSYESYESWVELNRPFPSMTFVEVRLSLGEIDFIVADLIPPFVGRWLRWSTWCVGIRSKKCTLWSRLLIERPSPNLLRSVWRRSQTPLCPNWERSDGFQETSVEKIKVTLIGDQWTFVYGVLPLPAREETSVIVSID